MNLLGLRKKTQGGRGLWGARIFGEIREGRQTCGTCSVRTGNHSLVGERQNRDVSDGQRCVVLESTDPTGRLRRDPLPPRNK